MSYGKLVDEIGEWLIRESLGWPDIAALFERLSVKLRAIGIPIDRARVIWPTLHPLFRAEMVAWTPGEPAALSGFVHQDRETEDWLRSPIRWMIENDIDMLRRRLTGPEATVDFLLMEELRDQGYSDFLAFKTFLKGGPPRPDLREMYGIYVAWATKDPRGFGDADLAALSALQQPLAVACKMAILPRITANIANTYLGPTAAQQVLAGHIQLGAGRQIEALVWYSDLRGSTRFAETLPEEAYLDLLNDYFRTVAEAAVEAGGEILAFIGDAVLAIFPIEGCACLDPITGAARRAAGNAFSRARDVNLDRAAAGKPVFGFGIGMNIGKVMFGNIGISQRLSFSVIGNTVNEVERIEKLTKALDHHLLVSASVAETEPGAWLSVGRHVLSGVDGEVELFRPADDVMEPIPPKVPHALDNVVPIGNA